MSLLYVTETMNKNNTKMQNKVGVRYSFLITLLFILLCSCQHPKITSLKTADEYFAQKGDSVTMDWHFNNADAVYVSGLEEEFKPIDGVTVYADYSKAYTVKAFQGNVDSAVQRKTIIVDGITMIEDIKDVSNEEEEENVTNAVEEKKQYKPSSNTDKIETAQQEAKKEIEVKKNEPEKIIVPKSVKSDTNPAAVYEEIPAIVSIIENNVKIKKEEPKLALNKESDKSNSKVISIEKNVKKPELEIQKGPLKAINPLSEKSFIESEYLKGITDSKDAIPSVIKVINSKYETDSKGFNLSLRALLLDQYGNFIRIDPKRTPMSFILNYGCGDDKTSNSMSNDCRAVFHNSEIVGADISILLDNSLASDRNNYIVNSIAEFSSNLTQQDKLDFSIFNQNVINIFNLQSAETAQVQLSKVELPEPNGLNALYKAGYQKLEEIQTDENTKAMVIITHYNDNSSILYRAGDIIESAKSKGVPIYIIAIGDAIRTYFLKYICGSTGGKLYHIFNDEVSSIKDILNEISFGLKNYYQIEFSLFDFPTKIKDDKLESKCEELQTKLIYKKGALERSDNVNIFPMEIPEYSQYQAVSIFEYQSTVIPKDYNGLIRTLANTLIDNPEYNIELIGNSGDEGEVAFNETISKERAEEVKNALINMGVASSRILTKGIGYRKPLYFNSKLPWQEGFNRRVEIRWLEPDKYPFEIIAGKYETESEAEYQSNQWTKNGLKSYYERYIENGESIYSVKLWGYTSVTQAKDAIKKLEKKYKNQFVIE
jgi:outer membrane protein OmpA-like peptidoglycan-associated protein